MLKVSQIMANTLILSGQSNISISNVIVIKLKLCLRKWVNHKVLILTTLHIGSINTCELAKSHRKDPHNRFTEIIKLWS